MTTVTLSKVKELRESSEETICFHAIVLIDGKEAGTVQNDGKGGAHRYQPITLEERLVALLGDKEPNDGTLDERTHRTMVTEVAINMMVCDALDCRDIKRALASRVVVETSTGQIRETKKLPKDHVLTTARTFVGRPGITRVLNLMPEAEAVALMRAKARA